MIPKEFETISEYVCKQTRWTDGSIRHDRMEDVVRCKDCIVFGTHGKNTDICPMWHNTHIDPYRDFCSRGVRKTENSSEKPNNCEHITEDGVTCAKYPACDDCFDNPLNKVKGSERLVKGSEQTDCQTCKWWSSYGYCVHRECKGYEPQTERSSE